MDRLRRSLKDLVEIIHDLDTRKIRFVSINEAIDTTTPAGKLVFHLFASLAEFVRNLILDRTVAGLAAARDRGRKGGRPPKLNESQIKKARVLLNDPRMTKAEVVRHFDVSRVTLDKALSPA